MIANITQLSKLEPFIRYNNNKVLTQEATVLDLGGTLFKKETKYAEYMINAFGNNVKCNRKDKFLHVSLNFLPADNAVLNDTTLKEIVSEYLIGIGFDQDHPYIVYKHDDTIHPHVHIVTSKIDINGKCITNASNYRKSQKITRELEIKYNLTRVSSQRQEAVVHERLADAPNLRDKLNFHIKNALEVLQVQSFIEFVMYLNNHNLDVQLITNVDFKNGEAYVYEGVVFNCLTGDFKQNQKGIKASSLYLKPTKKNLDVLFAKNKEVHKKTQAVIKRELDAIFSKYDQITLSDLKIILLRHDITLNCKEDIYGKIVGISFFDKKTGLKMTGENIGKNYTARKIQPFLGDTTTLKVGDKTSHATPKNVVVWHNLEKSKSEAIDRGAEIESYQNFDQYSFDSIETLESEAIQNDESISDIDRKKFNSLKKRKWKL